MRLKDSQRFDEFDWIDEEEERGRGVELVILRVFRGKAKNRVFFQLQFY